VKEPCYTLLPLQDVRAVIDAGCSTSRSSPDRRPGMAYLLMEPFDQPSGQRTEPAAKPSMTVDRTARGSGGPSHIGCLPGLSKQTCTVSLPLPTPGTGQVPVSLQEYTTKSACSNVILPGQRRHCTNRVNSVYLIHCRPIQESAAIFIASTAALSS